MTRKDISPEPLIRYDHATYLAKHDLVYESPPELAAHGIPLGDGSTGALMWMPPDALRFELGRCDLWDDGPERPFEPWGHEDEEVATALRAAGALSIRPGLPVLDRLYLSEFESRLDLHGAIASVHSVTPFGSMDAEIFAERKAGVVAIRYSDTLSEPVQREIALERWGTRVFGHWYSLVRRDPTPGLDGTASGVTDGVMWIRQQTRGVDGDSFATAVLVDSPDFTVEQTHCRAVRAVSEPTESAEFTVYVAVVSHFIADDPLGEAIARVERARDAGYEALRERQRSWWADFWSRSFVQLPNDYVENLWYLNHYVIGSSAGGPHPPAFINGIWPINRDTHPWNHLYHWNNQMLFWPGAGAGHPELADPWLTMRRDQLPLAQASARRRFDAEGAWFSDVADYRGWQAEGVPLLTPGLQIGLDAWRAWRHSGDEAFLRETAWPLIRETCLMYLDRSTTDENGVVHPPESHPYEHAAGYMVRDCLTDVAHMRALFPKAAHIAGMLGEAELAERFQYVAEHLVEPEIIPVPTEYLDGNGALKEGWAAGRKPPSDGFVSAGRRVDDDVPVYFRSNKAGVGSDHLFPSANESLVYPSGALGLSDRGTRLFDAMRTTALAHYEDGAFVMGWSVAQVIFARLGMREELVDSLDRHVDYFQHFPNGMWNYHPGWDAAETDLAGVAMVRDHDNLDHTFPFPQQPHAHYGLEPGAILQTTVNEMLLQSYDGMIRLAPACPDDWNASFVLWAEGGFRVSGVVRNGRIARAEIVSVRGERCRVVPDSDADGTGDWTVTDGEIGEAVEIVSEGPALGFATAAGRSYRIHRTGDTWETVDSAVADRNAAAKQHGKRKLGLPRLW